VIVVDPSGQVLHIRGDVSRYLSFPQGKIDTNILTLVRDDIKVDIRALLQKAKRDGQASTQALFFNNTEAEKALFITIQRLASDKASRTQDVFVISFTQVDLSEAFISGTGLLEADQTISNDNLRKEVAIFKERLQTSVEELETTNEELQSTNEELQSANEELQSANEELQTANEELQSTNEELSTVNQELEVKTYELEQVNNDLQNMLDKMNESIVLVDNRLRLLRYTHCAAEILGLRSTDIGQTITTLGLNIDIPKLRQELLNVIETENETQLRVRQDATVYQLRLVPYKSDALQVVGVMLFFDTPNRTSNQNPDTDAHQTLQHLADYLPFSVITLDKTGIITFASPSIETLLGYSPEEIRHKNVSQLMPEPYRQHHDDYLSHYLSGQSKGLMHQWRDITALTKDNRRLLLKLRVENTAINGEPHFLGYLIESEKLHELE
ncbi:MAG: PAS domain S-box protein, partial [Hydrogenovibrio sp.]